MPKKTPTAEAELDPDLLTVRALRLPIVVEMPTKPFGDMLRTARRISSRTQVEVSKKMQMTQGYLATLESGRVLPTLETLARFAGALGWELSITLEPPRARRPSTRSKNPTKKR